MTLTLEPLTLTFCGRSVSCVQYTYQIWSKYNNLGWVIDYLAHFGHNYVTLWPWPLTLCPWTCVVYRISCGQPMYQIWAWWINLRLSYWWLTTDFSSVFRGCSHLSIGNLKNAWPICTKFGGDIVRWYAHTKFNKKLCFCKDYSASIVHSTYICRGEVMDC